MFRKFKIREFERGFLYRDKEFKAILKPGYHWFFDPLLKIRVDIVSVREVQIDLFDLDVIAKSGALKNEALVLDLKDYERAIVWVDGRFHALVSTGLYGFWTVFNEVRAEIIDTHKVMFEHDKLTLFLKNDGGKQFDALTVEAGHAGLFFLDGVFQQALKPGTYAFWKNVGKVKLYHLDLREKVLEIPGQEIMTLDKVTLRINAIVNFRIVDALKTVMEVEDIQQALYREAQLALRAVIGTRELELLLTDKDNVAHELEEFLKEKSTGFGVQINSLGIRDVILPGEMKELLNKVTEAKKAAEANFITRREETAAMRSQANTAKVLENNPTLMRLRELEILEKLAANSNMKLVLGEKGLADRVVNIL